MVTKIKFHEMFSNNPDEELIKLIDSFLVNEYKVKEAKKIETYTPAFRPSSVAGCPRRLYFELKNYPKSKFTTGLSTRWLHIGTITHRWIQDDVLARLSEYSDRFKLIPPTEFKKEGIEIITEHDSSPNEVKFRDYRFGSLPVSAMVDGALEIDGEKFVFEFKTIKHEKFELLDGPLEEHITQGVFYAMSLGLPVIFLYIDKDNQKFKSYLHKYTCKEVTNMIQYIQGIEINFQNSVPPSKTTKKKDCTYCEYKKYCREVENGKKKGF